MQYQFPDPEKNPIAFFQWLKEESEKYWQKCVINDAIYGFQIQSGTKWNPGLSDQEILQYESKVGFQFPEILKQFLKVMNGTTPESINIYGRCGEPTAFSPGYYVFPKDILKVKDMIQWILEENDITTDEMKNEGIPSIFPITSHRFIIIDKSKNYPILSMYGDDIIAYAPDLPSFLLNDIFYNKQQDPNMDSALKVKLWLE